MRIFLFLFLLALLGCDREASNEVSFIPVTIEKKLPEIDGAELSLAITGSRDIMLELEMTDDDVTSLSVKLDDEGLSNGSDELLKSKIKNWIYHDVANLNQSNVKIAMGDERFVKISSWKDDEFFPVERFLNRSLSQYSIGGGFSYRIQLVPNLKEQIESISDIMIGTYFFDEENSSLDKIGSQKLTKFEGQDEIIFGGGNYLEIFYDIFQDELHGGYLLDATKKRNNLYARIDNYTINYRNGTSRKYSDFENEYKQSFSQIIFFDGSTLKSFHVRSGLKLDDILRNNNYLLHVDINGHLIAVNKLKTSLKLPLNWNDLAPEDLDRGIWRVYGASRIDDTVESGQVYVVAYDTVRNIAPKKIVTKIIENHTDSYIAVSEVSKGDIIEIEISGETLMPMFDTIVKEVDYDISMALEHLIELESGSYKVMPIGLLNHKDLCLVWHRQFSGEVGRNIIFSREGLAQQLAIKLKGRQYSVADLLFENNEIAIMDGGRIAKWRMRVPDDSSQMLIMLDRKSDIVTESVGFIDWHSCPGRIKSGFKLKNYSTVSKEYSYRIKKAYDLSLRSMKVL